MTKAMRCPFCQIAQFRKTDGVTAIAGQLNLSTNKMHVFKHNSTIYGTTKNRDPFINPHKY